MLSRSRLLKAAAVVLAAGLVAAACGGSKGSSAGGKGSSAGGSSASPITIGLITDRTGLAASSFLNAQYGAEARIAAQNATGGVNGHKLVLAEEDDQSSPSGNLTAAQLLQQKGAFGIIEDSSFTFGSYRYLNQQGIPVTGAAIDGPEWGEPPNTNMFSVIGVGATTPIHGKYYSYDNFARFLKDVGVTKLAGLSFAIPSAIQANASLFQYAAPLGIAKCYQDNSVPFGATDFTSTVLSIKSAGCDGVSSTSLLSSDIALSNAIKQAGLSHVKQLYYTAYDQNLVDQPNALAAMQGDYAETAIDYSNPTPGAQKMLAELKQYTPFHGGIPSLNISQGWAAADLMIKGLELAGKNPTRQAFITDLRQVSGYTAGGLYLSPGINFTNFGSPAQFPKTSCGYIVQIVANGYVSYNGGKPVCGNLTATNPAG